MTDFDARSLTRRLTDAQRTYERERARLFRPDGTPTWGPAEHEECMAALQAAFDADLQYVETCIAAELASIREAELLLDRDPLFNLDAEALTCASALAGFLADDLDVMDADDLLTAVDTASAAGDRAALALYQRLAARQVARRQPASVTGQLSDAETERQRCARAVMQAASRALVDPKDERRRAKLEQRSAAVAEVREAIKRATGQDRATRVADIVAAGRRAYGLPRGG